MSAKFTAVDKRDCVIREANMRRLVYPRRIAAGKMSQARADREIAMMDEIAAEYGVLGQAETLERARSEASSKERDLFV